MALKYQVFYESVVQLIEHKQDRDIKNIMLSQDSFYQWVSSTFTVHDDFNFSALYQDLKSFFVRTCPHLLGTQKFRSFSSTREEFI